MVVLNVSDFVSKFPASFQPTVLQILPSIASWADEDIRAWGHLAMSDPEQALQVVFDSMDEATRDAAVEAIIGKMIADDQANADRVKAQREFMFKIVTGLAGALLAIIP